MDSCREILAKNMNGVTISSTNAEIYEFWIIILLEVGQEAKKKKNPLAIIVALVSN